MALDFRGFGGEGQVDRLGTRLDSAALIGGKGKATE